MNSYCERVFNRIQVNIRSVTTIINDVTEEELAYRPLPHKRSIQELLQHLCLICTADYHISLGYSADKMNDFYLQHPSYTKLELKAALIDGFNQLKAPTLLLTNESYFHRRHPIGDVRIRTLNGCLKFSLIYIITVQNYIHF